MPVIGNNSRCGVGMDVAREGSEGLMSGNFESLPYERFSAVMTINTSVKQDRIWSKIGFGASIAQDVSNAGCGLPGCAM